MKNKKPSLDGEENLMKKMKIENLENTKKN